LAQAVAFVNADLDENGLTAFDVHDPVARDQAVAATVAVSLKQLGEMQPRFEELAIFAAQVEIPLETVTQLWQATARLSKVNSEKFCQRLHSLSLLTRFDLLTRSVRMHDVMRTLLRSRLPVLETTHAALTSAWGDPLNLPDDYAWHWIAFHLAEGGNEDQLRGLLLDFNWLHAKLAKTEIASLISDYDYLLRQGEPGSSGAQQTFHRIQKTLRLSAHVLATDRSQLAGQLLGRIVRDGASGCQPLLDAARRWKGVPWLRPLKPSFTGGGGPLLQTLVTPEHAERVVAVYETGGEWRAISASRDVRVVNKLRIWDLKRGELVRSLPGGIGPVNALTVYRDEHGWRAVSASWDGYGKNGLRLWDIEETNPGPRLLADPGYVYAMAIDESRAHCFVSGLGGQFDLWDLKAGVLRDFETYAYDINGVAVYDGEGGAHVACACQDKNVRVWNIGRQDRARVFKGHTAAVNAVAVFKSDGRWLGVSASSDKTLRLWDFERVRAVRTMRGHTGDVRAVAVYQAGPELWRAVSASEDNTLKIWDLRSGRELQTLYGHGDWVGGVAVYKETEGWRALSVSDDGTLKVWDLETAPGRLRTRAAVTSVAVYDGRTGICAVTGSADGSVSVWSRNAKQRVRCSRSTPAP
jgi:WD40 repeat protein